ncbi:xanthine dehydrogenase family protein subunit M [Roseomonas sp. KE2513]|uniref:FAD binding domain-containing protein n=1 Tax=Roseomonas sp. KE2513 TaxID=2479202 RepID=UPI0018DFB69C|nr:FAD binding domain-containing protein [Roseomonas sp. KE2513]MBI0537949.1 xanthine dehydrogenase family protein subunit M [Roseomonas sp. KE2513]
MKPARFDYARPETLDAALAALAEHGAEASVLAGGQSLIPMLNLRMARPGLLLDINRIPGLDGISLEAGLLMIGARTRHADVLISPLVRQAAPMLTEALHHVAHPAIRNRGTIGGSISLADPAAEMPACMVALGATLIAASARGERRIPAEGFFRGVYATALKPDELLLRIEIPAIAPGWTHGFTEVSRRHGDYAMAGLALALRREAGRVADARIALCGLEPAPRRQHAAEAVLVASGAEAACDALSAPDAMAGAEVTAAHRLHLARVLLRRALAN